MGTIDYHEGDPLDNDFQYLFNSGYTLAKFQPKVLEQLLFEAEQNGTRGLEGLLWGKREFENELKKDQVKEFAQLRNKSRNRDKDFDRDR